MSDVTIEQLAVEINSNSQNAVGGIDALSASLSKLKSSVKGGVGLTSVAKQITNLNTALAGMDSSSASKIDRLANSLSKLSALGKIKISSSIGNQIKAIGQAASSLNGTDFSGVANLGNALQPLSGIQKASGLQNTITQLNKLPELAKTLNAINWTQFTQNIQKLSTALTPLASQLNQIGSAFSKLPANIRQTVSATNSLAKTNNVASKSYVNLWAKARMATQVIRVAIGYITDWITSSNKYIEDLNLFTVSMGEYAEEAYNYAQKVSEVMGIDPAEWMRNQGVFNTIIKGFGVAGEKAAFMSKNLTQLGYDISSFYNISFEESMQKLQSGISGELEPLRRLGYDLSVARLQQEAYRLGIDKTVSSMTQAEKSQLRYYAIMTQVTDAQGDMARTLTAPANQLRILKAQVELTARAFGNLFIPILNMVIPYAIAVAKVLRYLAEVIASFFGITLPEVDWGSFKSGSSAIGGLADNADDASTGLGKAAKAAKKLKNNLLGIDELNIIMPDTDEDSSSGSGKNGLGNLGGDLGIDLPGYDFLKGALDSKVDDIVQKIKDHLQEILTIALAIGAAILGWKLGKFLQSLGLMKQGLLPLVGLALAFAGAASYIMGFIDAWKNGLDKSNMIELLAGAAGVVGGLALAFGAWGAAIGAAVTGIGLFVLGIKDAITNGLNWLNGCLIPIGAALGGAGIGGIIGMLIGSIGGPLGAAIGAAIGLAIGLLTDLIIYLYQNWDEVTAYFDKLFKVTIPNLAKAGVDKVVTFFQSLPERIRTFFDNVDTFFDNLPDIVDKVLTGIQNKLRALPGKIRTWFNDRAKDIREHFKKMLKPIQDFDWKDLGHRLGKFAGETFKKISEAMDETKKALKDGFKKFFTETLPKFVKEGLPKIGKSILEFIVNLPKEIEDIKSSIKEGFANVGQAIWDGIVEGWNTACKAIGDFITGLIEGFKEGLGIHSPSTVFRDEIGKFLGEGILEGIAAPFKAIGTWIKEHITDPIQETLDGNPIEAGIDLIKNGWNTVSEWVQSHIGSKVEKGIDIVRNGWSTVADWVRSHIGNKVEKGIDLIRNAWSTVADWVRTHIGNKVEKGIDLIRNAWTTVADWVRTHIGNKVEKGIDLIRNAWTTVADWVRGYIGNKVEKGISIIRDGWSTVADWVKSHTGGTVSKGISLMKDGWSTVADWVSNSIGGSVSVGIKLFKDGWDKIKDFFGLSSGGYDTGRGFKLFANGGFVNSSKSGYWGIPAYGNGGITHGSLFVAGEAGTEMVGRIGGQTEVLNQSQIKLAMRSAVISGMAQFTPILSAINSNIVTCANGVINSIVTGAQVLYNGIDNVDTYDPTGSLAYNTYEDATEAYRKGVNDESMYSSMRDFYREFVEPTLKDIASDTKRQADKEENIHVQVGNRDVTRAVEIQKDANGYSFT